MQRSAQERQKRPGAASSARKRPEAPWGWPGRGAPRTAQERPGAPRGGLEQFCRASSARSAEERRNERPKMARSAQARRHRVHRGGWRGALGGAKTASLALGF